MHGVIRVHKIYTGSASTRLGIQKAMGGVRPCVCQRDLASFPPLVVAAIASPREEGGLGTVRLFARIARGLDFFKA